MSFPLLMSSIDIKVFIDFDEAYAFLKEHGAAENQLPTNREVAGTTFGGLIQKHRVIVVWLDEQWSSGIALQTIIAHESVHVLSKILRAQGERHDLPEESRAQAIGSIYGVIAKQLEQLGVDFNKPKPEFEPRTKIV